MLRKICPVAIIIELYGLAFKSAVFQKYAY